MKKRDERRRAGEIFAICFNIPAFSPRCHHVITTLSPQATRGSVCGNGLLR